MSISTRICLLVTALALAVPGLAGTALPADQPTDQTRERQSLSSLSEDQAVLHVLNRLTLGPGAGDLQKVATRGVRNFIQQQLSPSSIPEPAELERALERIPSLHMNPVEIFRTYGKPPKPPKSMSEEDRKARRRKMVGVMQEAVRARVLRALYSERQLQEVLVDFWFNHFNVFAGKGLDRIWVGAYERDAIRPHVLGKFRALLGATARHPAMLFYLDNWLNTAPNSPGARGRFKGLNENYARELLELHTLGVDGGYSQKDVVSLAKVLTGWGIPGPAMRWRMRAAFSNGTASDIRPMMGTALSTGFFFDSARHDFSDKVFLGRTIKGRGREEVTEVLDILAAHPSTARHICSKLAQCFVADDPPEELVNRMAEVFRKSDGNIGEVLRSLFDSKEFSEPRYFGAKFKSPYRYVISALRATGTRVENHLLVQRALRQMGMPLYGILTPDGYKNTTDEWLNPDAMTKRINFSMALSNGRLPFDREAVADPDHPVGPKPASDVAGPLIDFQALIPLMGKALSPATRKAVEEAPPRVKAGMILASPEFMRY